LDIYPPQDVEIENYLDLADLIGDSDSPKKEKMANAKILDQHFAKKKFCCGDAVSLADYAIYSAIGSIDEKTRGKNLQAFCARMEKL
jgi:glutathione S-transferase